MSPVAASSITGFGLIADPSNTFSTSPRVSGKVYAADYAAPTPATMTTAINDMQTAFTDAAGRSNPDFTELHAGDISGRTLVPGLYKWGTGLLVTSAGVTATARPRNGSSALPKVSVSIGRGKVRVRQFRASYL